MNISIEPIPSDLPQHHVEVVEPGQSAEHGWVSCEIDKHIRFDTVNLESYCSADWRPVVYDAFVVAAAVEYCDRAKARQSATWGRHISLRVRVHNPDQWNNADVGNVLATLTGDRWTVEFMPRAKSAPCPRQVPLTMENDARAVIPFSDGLDSLAASSLMEEEYGPLLRVRLGRSPFHQQGSRQRFAGVPFRVTGFPAKESSFRSRAFKFALLTGVAAFLARLSTVIVAESGQGILGPPLLSVGQEYEDLRAHPYFFDRMAAFLGKLLGTDICYAYPRIWYTKAETLIEYFRTHIDNGDAWRSTRSCWQDQRHSSVDGALRQCGICSACLLRRMSLHAAGRPDDECSYIWETLAKSSFNAGAAAGYEIKGEAMHTHFVNGATGLDQLAKLPNSPWSQDVIDHQVRRLCRSPSLAKGRSLNESDVRTKVVRLLTQHAKEWQEFKESLGKSSFLVELLEQEGV